MFVCLFHVCLWMCAVLLSIISIKHFTRRTQHFSITMLPHINHRLRDRGSTSLLWSKCISECEVYCNCNTLTSASCQHDFVWIKIQMASGSRAFHIHSMFMFVDVS